MLVLVCGLPGSGKSIAARKIATHFRGVHLNTDSVRRRIFLHGSPEQAARDPERFDLEYAFDKLGIIPPEIQEKIWKQKELVYEKFFEEAAKELKEKNVVLDATFYDSEKRERVYGIARRAGKNVYIVECEASLKETQKRIERRRYKKKASNVADMRIFEKVKKRYDDPKKDGIPLLAYDTASETFRYFNVTGRHDVAVLKKFEEILKIPLHRLRQE